MSDGIKDYLCKKCGARINFGEPKEYDLCEQCRDEVSEFMRSKERHTWVQSGEVKPTQKFIDGEKL